MFAHLISQTAINTNPPRSAIIDGAQVVGNSRSPTSTRRAGTSLKTLPRQTRRTATTPRRATPTTPARRRRASSSRGSRSRTRRPRRASFPSSASSPPSTILAAAQID